MKKLFSLTIALLIVSGAYLSAQDLDEILDHYFEVIGQDKITRVNTITSEGKVLQMGMELPFVLIQKKPSKIRMEAEIQGTKFIQAYDGENGWMIAPWTGSPDPQDMPDEQIKAMRDMGDIEGDLYNWDKKGHEVSLIGKEDMEGTPVYKIKLVKENGDEYLYYIDAENYVVLRTDVKTTVQGTEVNSSTYLSNFKPVEGMIMPFSMESKMNGQVVSQIMVDTYRIDEPVDDNVFTKPASKNAN